MKLIQIAGYLGSGKTTLIIEVGKRTSRYGLKIAILVNEVGEIPVDGRVISEYGLTVKDIGGGCICCQVVGNMTNTLKIISREINPDIVIIEPTGIAVPHTIIENIASLSREINISKGPVIVLFDTTRVDKLLKYDTLIKLVTTQLKDADIIALSKIDAVSETAIEKASKYVMQINPKATVLKLSTKSGVGLDYITNLLKECSV